jgi:hypothetical protein
VSTGPSEDQGRGHASTRRIMVTSREMCLFALDCLRWSEGTDNASHRAIIVRIAKTWLATASALDRRVDAGDEIFPDLRGKLD